MTHLAWHAEPVNGTTWLLTHPNNGAYWVTLRQDGSAIASVRTGATKRPASDMVRYRFKPVWLAAIDTRQRKEITA